MMPSQCSQAAWTLFPLLRYGLLRRETFTNLLILEASGVAQLASSTRKINQPGQLISLELGRLLSRRAELYDLSAVQRRGTLQRFPKVLRYIKLNYLCHDHLLLYEPLCRSWDPIPLSRPNLPTQPIRTH